MAEAIFDPLSLCLTLPLVAVAVAAVVAAGVHALNPEPKPPSVPTHKVRLSVGSSFELNRLLAGKVRDQGAFRGTLRGFYNRVPFEGYYLGFYNRVPFKVFCMALSWGSPFIGTIEL